MSWKQAKLASLGEDHIWLKGAWRGVVARDGSRKGDTNQDVESPRQFTQNLGNGKPFEDFFRWAVHFIELRLKSK